MHHSIIAAVSSVRFVRDLSAKTGRFDYPGSELSSHKHCPTVVTNGCIPPRDEIWNSLAWLSFNSPHFFASDCEHKDHPEKFVHTLLFLLLNTTKDSTHYFNPLSTTAKKVSTRNSHHPLLCTTVYGRSTKWQWSHATISNNLNWNWLSFWKLDIFTVIFFLGLGCHSAKSIGYHHSRCCHMYHLIRQKEPTKLLS